MKKNNFLTGFKLIVVLSIMITVGSIVLNFEVAQIILNEDVSSLHQLEKEHPHSDVSVICVQYTTDRSVGQGTVLCLDGDKDNTGGRFCVLIK